MLMTIMRYVFFSCIAFIVPFLITSFTKYSNKRFIVSIICSYISIAFSVTVLSRETYLGNRFLLIPLWSYINLAGSLKNGFFMQVVLNILGFVPLGCFFLILTGDIKRSIAYCFLVSLFIEVAQLVAKKGLFEIDDLIHNTVGGICGCILYKKRHKTLEALKKLKKKVWRH